MRPNLLSVVLLAACRSAPAVNDAPELGAELARELDVIAGFCAKSDEGECKARHGPICDSMWRTAHACFDHAKPPMDCTKLRADVGGGLAKRRVPFAVQESVSGMCEGACKLRGEARPWDDVALALQATGCSD